MVNVFRRFSGDLAVFSIIFVVFQAVINISEAVMVILYPVTDILSSVKIVHSSQGADNSMPARLNLLFNDKSKREMKT